MITYASYFTHRAVISSIKCTLNGLGISIQLFLIFVCPSPIPVSHFLDLHLFPRYTRDNRSRVTLNRCIHSSLHLNLAWIIFFCPCCIPFIFASLPFRYFLAAISTIFAMRSVFSVLRQSTISAKTLSTLLAFVRCAWLLTSIYLRWLSHSSQLCIVNSVHESGTTRLTALVCFDIALAFP